MDKSVSVLCGLWLFLTMQIPSSLTRETGAPQSSCYDHSIVHINTFNPEPNVKQSCTTSQCTSTFELIDEVDPDTLTPLNTNVSQRILECNSVYLFRLTTITMSGYLIQARNTSTFMTSASIFGTWIEDSFQDRPRYNVLQCGINQDNTNALFNNSATQANRFMQTTINFYWKAPSEPVTLWFQYTVAATFNTFYFPFITPNVSVQCEEPTTEEPTTEEPTTEEPTTEKSTTEKISTMAAEELTTIGSGTPGPQFGQIALLVVLLCIFSVLMK